MNTNQARLSLVIGLILILVTGCFSPTGNPTAPTSPDLISIPTTPEPNQPLPSSPSQDLPTAEGEYSTSDLSNWTKSGAAAVWPAYIPADIPQPEGLIRKTMEGDISMRIFYGSMTPAAFDQWINLLEEQGFSLEYVVYVEEGFPDNSEERIRKGDFDAVKISKGDYQLEITYGSESPVLDIAISGFEFPGYSNTEPTPSGPVWPAEYALVIPQPARCTLIAVEPVPPHDYRILCQPADAQVLADYQNSLQAAGYSPNTVIPASDGSLDGSIYAWGSREISFEQPSTDLLIITIADTSASSSQWPAPLAGVVPAPVNCPIENVLAISESNYLISCNAINEKGVTDYIALLAAQGFIETSRMQTQTGQLVQVKFEKDGMLVDQMISPQPSAWGIHIAIQTK